MNFLVSVLLFLLISFCVYDNIIRIKHEFNGFWYFLILIPLFLTYFKYYFSSDDLPFNFQNELKSSLVSIIFTLILYIFIVFIFKLNISRLFTGTYFSVEFFLLTLNGYTYSLIVMKYKEIEKVKIEIQKINLPYLYVKINENSEDKIVTVNINEFNARFNKKTIELHVKCRCDMNEIKELIELSIKNSCKLIFYEMSTDQSIVINGEIAVYNNKVVDVIDNSDVKTFSQKFKRLFDIILSVFLLVTAMPIFIIISVLIKIDSNGSIIFKHERVGYKGKKFYCYKFRTMYADANERLKKLLEKNPALKEEWEKEFKLKNDPRVTRIGRILRKTSLDELPQLVNIIKGDMSLVGPRPITEDEIKKYGKYIYYYLSVKPGLTGLWQVSGRNDITYDERVKLDVWYSKNWDIIYDMYILFKTFTAIVFKKGAY
ncbi:exopolysaccharide biosynthesis polyprenyl glycosylphosphotransferase [Carboxydothermus ferrireducens]|uniref:exopolysaccharide biosynthesis polyprenyl glycosylphosphotransferase n=1 Tax=Carboxydothermus ferrireducens TaxID=54265 RepID=UPI001C547B91|nr:exopolysaccharide biosynthesis polyprenyl glycosylphosphotransferase [Carboxydothermus ferrireducens]